MAGSIPSQKLSKSAELIAKPFVLPIDVKEQLYGPYIRREKLFKSLVGVIKRRGLALFVASSSVGKTTGVTQEMVELSGNFFLYKPFFMIVLGEGIRNIVRVSMRDVPSDKVLHAFADALEIDTSQGSWAIQFDLSFVLLDVLAIQKDIHALASHCVAMGNPLVMIVEDLHSP